MANKYYVKIKSPKMTQKIASEILQKIATKNLIYYFHYDEEGYLSYKTRGLTDITGILENNNFTIEEIKVEDEFEYFYKNMMTPKEAIKKDVKEVVNRIQRFEEYNTQFSEELKNIQAILNNFVEEKNNDKTV